MLQAMLRGGGDSHDSHVMALADVAHAGLEYVGQERHAVEGRLVAGRVPVAEDQRVTGRGLEREEVASPASQPAPVTGQATLCAAAGKPARRTTKRVLPEGGVALRKRTKTSVQSRDV